MNGDGQKCGSTLQIIDIPTGVTDSALETALQDYGPIRRCFIVRKKHAPTKAKKSIGYVEFAFEEDAERCLSDNANGVKLSVEGESVQVRLRWDQRGGSQAKATEDGHQKNIDQIRHDRMVAKKKKARLIVRNLSFKAMDDDLRKHFSSCGSIEEVHILTKPDGKRVGCAFVQFSNVQEAAKAIKKLNMTEIVGRKVAVDWAVDKKTFQSSKGQENGIKQEVDDDEVGHINDNNSDRILNENEIKEEPEIDDEDDEKDEDQNETEKEESEENFDDDDEEDDEEFSDDDDGETDVKRSKQKQHSLTTGHDISENKTVFLRNLSFDVDQETLREHMETKFGPVFFAKIVYDKLTEHPKGTAFVKFKEENHAEACLAASEHQKSDENPSEHPLWLEERRMYAVKALSKEDADSKMKEKKKKEAKDSRNLHLAVEGLVRRGTQAAIGVSEADMQKRLQFEKWKRQMLKNLNNYVSPFRLCLRNIPLNFTDQKLKKMVLKHSSKDCKITEAKIMRDLKTVDPKTKLGKSKGYGFVTFTKHEDALKLLRKLNNNPDIFRPESRPIVEFSIENRKAVIARQKRLEKSKEKNPNFKGQKQSSQQSQGNFAKKESKDSIEDRPQYLGAINNPKNRKLPSHVGEKVRHNPRPQSKISRKDVRKLEAEKRMSKKMRKRLQKKSETSENAAEQKPDEPKKAKKKKNRKPKEEVKELREDKSFTKLVENYKRKLNSSDDGSVVKKKKKWFDDQ